MELEDYENDPYAPRPKASQRVAAQKRARQSDTEPEAPATRGIPLAPIALVAAGALLVGVLSYGLGQSTARPLQLAPTDIPARAFVPAPSVAPPAPTTATEPTIPPTFPPAPVVVPPEPPPQTGRGLPYTEPTPAPPVAPPEPPPPPPTAVPDWPTSAPASPADFAKPDIKQTCQFVGCLGQQAVDLARAQFCHALFWQYGNTDAETIPEPDHSAVRGCIWEGLYR